MVADDIDCFLYHSMLAESADARCVAEIVKTARHFNSRAGLTGLLVFDGQRFCQYLEGPQAALTALVAKLQRDPRHTRFTPLLHAPLGGARRFQHWAMGYAYVDDGDPLSAIAALPGDEALQYLQALAFTIDAV